MKNENLESVTKRKKEKEEFLPVNISEETVLKGWGYRHQQCFILFCCLSTGYSMRVCMSISLVAMTGTAHSSVLKEHIINNSSVFSDTEDINYNKFDNSHELNYEENISGLLFVPPFPKFKWDKKTQDTIQSAFFWGYMVLQIPAGQLLHHFGTRYLLTGALLLNCVISLLFPWAAYYGGWILMMVFRIFQGLGQAFLMPGIHTLLGKWAPLEERGRLLGFVLSGQAMGILLGLTVTGFIASSPLGWPGIFRFYGILSGISGGLTWWMIADTPSKHRSISVAEKRYIHEKLGEKCNMKINPVPWAKILRCRGLYANVIAHIGATWGQVTLYSEVPAFMDKVMRVNIKANGMLSAFPFFIMWFANFIFSWFTDMLIVKKCLSVTNSRKLSNSMGCVPPAIGLIVLAYTPKNVYVVEIILIIICSFKTATAGGFFSNHIDIAPNYSGTMLSISNFVSNLCASMAPLLAGFILTDVSNVILWRKVFLVSAGMFFFTNLLYVTLGTAERADWDNIEYENEKDSSEKESNKPMLENNLI